MTDRTETDEILDGYLTADFDPLQAFVFDDDTDADDEAPSVLAEGPFNMPNPEAAPQFQRDLVAFDNGETAEERIDALFAQMPTFHKMLFTIMGTCASPLPTADLEEVIAEMKRHHHSVYEPLTLCNLLERAGAKRVELESPRYQKLEQRQIARETSLDLQFMGIEDD